jgi:serine/threonine-protein kinase
MAPSDKQDPRPLDAGHNAPQRLPADHAFPQVPGYELLGILGRGGMGVVYKARQSELKRLVALKMILHGDYADEAQKQRFRREAEAVARLRHPHIVQVYTVGQHNGLPFVALEYCAGGSLKQKLAGQPMDPRAAAQLIETVAQAMDAAHQKQIVHRDLKPHNILLTETGEPKITDFGLAKTFAASLGLDRGVTGPTRLSGSGNSSTLTEPGDVLGTPSYMPPEQARGERVGPLADVYALGAILYELLTGRPPFVGDSLAPTLTKVLNEEPLPPRHRQPSVPRDLETICLYCLHKQAGRRYASAAALAEDLRRFQAGEPIRARPVGRLERACKWAKRRPALASLLILTVAALGGLSGATVLLSAANQRERQAKDDAIKAQLYAEEQHRQALQAQQIAEEKEQEALRGALNLIRFFSDYDPAGLEGLGFRSGRDRGTNPAVLKLLEVATESARTDVKNQPVIQAAMLDTLGNVHRSLGWFAKAQPMLEKGLALRQQNLGNEHEDTATSLYHLARLYHDQGNLRDAEKLYRQALAIRDKRFGKNSVESAQTMFNLAWVLSQDFEKPCPAGLAEAEELFRQVLEIRRDKLGKDHHQVGVTLAALAAVMLGKNDKQALSLAMQAITVLEKAENKDPTASGFMRYLLAVQARQAGRLHEADLHYQSLLSQANHLLGDEHPLVALLLGDYAGLLSKKGDLPGAEKAIRRALDIGRRCYLRGHPAMIDALLKLGDYERDQGKTPDAEKLYREAQEIARQFGRPNLQKAAQQRLLSLIPLRQPKD